MSAKPTPTPWFLVKHPNGWTIQTKETGAGIPIAQQYAGSDEEYGTHIVRCVNARPAVVEAIEDVLSHRDGDLPARGWLNDNGKSRQALQRLADALALVKGE